MTLGHHKRAVGTFATYRDAETALYELRDSGFPMDRVSVVGRDADRHGDIQGASTSDRVVGQGKQVAQDTEADETAKTGAITGGALGGLTGLLVGLGALAIPGIGPVMAGGALATALATTLSGGAIGAATGGVIGGLVGLGIPEEHARGYNDRLSRGEYLVMVEGSEEEVHRAERILGQRGVQAWGVYDAPAHSVSQQRSVAPTGVADPGNMPAGTLYPSGQPTAPTGTDFPAGTAYPQGTPQRDQVPDRRDLL